MTIHHERPRSRGSIVPPREDIDLTNHQVVSAEGSGAVFGRTLALLRLAIGFVFLWAFLDKLFGLGYATGRAAAWIHGGSPTQGFLSHVQVGPLRTVFHDWAGAGWVDLLFMLGLLGVGVAVMLGIGLRLSAVAGSLLLVLMWAAEWPMARHTVSGVATVSSNPFLDYHLIYALVLIAVAVGAAGRVWGLGRAWCGTALVRRHPWLR